MTVGFNPDVYDVNEGMTANIQVMLTGSASFQVTVNFQTADQSAGG